MRLGLYFLGALVVGSVRPAASAAQYGPRVTCPAAVADGDSTAAPGSSARAVRCAEWFIVQQGFTEQPVSDTAAIVRDFEETGFPTRTLLELRRGSLAPKAYGVCTGLSYRSAYNVVFLYAGAAASDSVGRTVSMTRALAGMYVTHQAMYLAPVRTGEFGCRLLPSGTGRRQHN